jgi:Glycosyl transferase family 2
VSGPLVTLGVPVYGGGEDFRAALAAIKAQTYDNIEVLISVDNCDAPSAAVAQPFLEDSRFRLHVQPARLGWDGNTDWTIRHRRGDFYIYHQHDDEVSRSYVADLVAAAHRYPHASVLYSEMLLTGLQDLMVRMPSLTGRPIERALAHIGRLDAAPLRGLIRGSALDTTSGLASPAPNTFGIEHRFLTQLALAGEFRLVVGPTYYKRLHGKNVHLKFAGWAEDRKRGAWAALCAALIAAIVKAGGTPAERWRLTMAVLDRFLVVSGGLNWLRRPKRWLYGQDNFVLQALRNAIDRARRGGELDLWANARSRHAFCNIDMNDHAGRGALLGEIFRCLRDEVPELPSLLDLAWPEAERRAAAELGVRSHSAGILSGP